jgi:hypothetical protein
MNFLKPSFLALTLAFGPVAAWAEDIPDDVRAAVTEQVDALSADFSAGDIAATFDYVPDKLFAQIADSAGVPADVMMTMVKEQISTAMATVTVESFLMNMDTATYETTPDGSRQYVVIPTETIMTVEGAGKIRSTGNSLALEDEGSWYLISVDDPSQAQFLSGAYPEFEGVTFPAAVVTPAE